MDGPTNRRRFLTSVGVGMGLIAGCSGGSDTESSPPNSESATTQRSTAAHPETSETKTETKTTTQQESMSTVFHFAKSGAKNQRHALANVENLVADETTPTDEIVLVANSAGVELLTKEQSEYPDRVTALLDDNVSFRACENSMQAQDLTADDLIEGVETVPAGVGELTKLQANGFAYIETP